MAAAHSSAWSHLFHLVPPPVCLSVSPSVSLCLCSLFSHLLSLLLLHSLYLHFEHPDSLFTGVGLQGPPSWHCLSCSSIMTLLFVFGNTQQLLADSHLSTWSLDHNEVISKNQLKHHRSHIHTQSYLCVFMRTLTSIMRSLPLTVILTITNITTASATQVLIRHESSPVSTAAVSCWQERQLHD